MAKTIQVIVKCTIELPSNAEVIRFTDEDGVTEDHIKFAGKLIRPDVGWMEYKSSDINKANHPNFDWIGIGWEGIDDDLYNNHFIPLTEKWYLEELEAAAEHGA